MYCAECSKYTGEDVNLCATCADKRIKELETSLGYDPNQIFLDGMEYVCGESLEKQVKKILETPCWYPSLESGYNYKRKGDMSPDDEAHVLIEEDGDGILAICQPHSILGVQFCTPMIGGGRSPRTLMAIRILALAIKLDNEERKI